MKGAPRPPPGDTQIRHQPQGRPGVAAPSWPAHPPSRPASQVGGAQLTTTSVVEPFHYNPAPGSPAPFFAFKKGVKNCLAFPGLVLFTER